MSKTPIEVRVHERGTLSGDQPSEDPNTLARCDLCGAETEAVASLSAGAFACKVCLRERLEAITVGLFMLKGGAAKGLPWGKISG
jgi:hypothetical protein